MPGWLQGRLLSACLWKDINSAELDETELILLLSILFIFYKQGLSVWLMQQKWRIYCYLSNYLNEISVAGTDSMLKYVSLDVSSRPWYSIFSRLVLVFLEVFTKGMATIFRTNEYCLLWKVIYWYILFPVVLPFCCKPTVGSCAILVQWFWKCLLWEAERNFHQNFSFLFWSKIH